MMNDYGSKLGEDAGRYGSYLREGYPRSGIVGWLVPVGWFTFPVALQTVLHPTDALGLEHYLQGEAVPRAFTAQAVTAGEGYALVALAVLLLLQLVGTVLFYRRVRLTEVIEGERITVPALWPLACLFAGVVGNGLWWFGTGHFDPTGAVFGVASTSLTIGCEIACEKLGRDFVFGSEAAAPQASSGSW